MIANNSVVKIQNLIMNHESQPIKLNPETSIYFVHIFKVRTPTPHPLFKDGK